ncbi:MAG: phenol hydroxylase [Neptuniibacter sp.]
MSNVNEHGQGSVRPEFLGGIQKFIRVRSPESARFVEFDFAIGEPNLFVELIMPQGAFKHFCEKNEVVHMTDEQMKAVDAEMEKWRYGEDTLMARNHNSSTE